MPRKNILQTDSPHGFYRHGDAHPFVSERYFDTYKRNKRGREFFEEWLTKEALIKGSQARLKNCAKRQAEKRGDKPKKLQLQTKRPIGSFKFGDAHPFIQDRFFLGYRKRGGESWVSSDRKIKNARRCDELKWQRRKNMKAADPNYRQIINCLYDYRDRLNVIFGFPLFHIDHTIPITKGGCHHPDNLQVVPAKWNLSKSNINLNRWMIPYEEIF